MGNQIIEIGNISLTLRAMILFTGEKYIHKSERFLYGCTARYTHAHRITTTATTIATIRKSVKDYEDYVVNP